MHTDHGALRGDRDCDGDPFAERKLFAVTHKDFFLDIYFSNPYTLRINMRRGRRNVRREGKFDTKGRMETMKCATKKAKKKPAKAKKKKR